MTMSIAGSLMTSRAFAVRSPGGSVMPRSVVGAGAATFTKASGTPSRCRITPALVVRTLTTPVPTVPNPIKPTAIRSFTESALFFPAGEFERLLDAANRLSRAVLVLDETEADVLVAVLAEPDARRHRDLGLVQEQLGEFQRSHGAVRVGDAGPDEHGRQGLFDLPTDAVQSVDQDIAPVPIEPHGFLDAVLGAVQRDDGGDLDRLEDAVIEVALDLLEGSDHLGVAHTEPHPPARHVVALGHGEELHAHVFGAGGLEKARGLVPIEDDVRISQVVHHIDVIFLREGHDLLEERQVHDGRGRIVREVEDQHLGTGQRAAIGDRKSTRLNSSHGYISYAVFCLKKKISFRLATTL